MLLLEILAERVLIVEMLLSLRQCHGQLLKSFISCCLNCFTLLLFLSYRCYFLLLFIVYYYLLSSVLLLTFLSFSLLFPLLILVMPGFIM